MNQIAKNVHPTTIFTLHPALALVTVLWSTAPSTETPLTAYAPSVFLPALHVATSWIVSVVLQDSCIKTDVYQLAPLDILRMEMYVNNAPPLAAHALGHQAIVHPVLTSICTNPHVLIHVRFHFTQIRF